MFPCLSPNSTLFTKSLLTISVSEKKLSSTVIIKHANPCGVSSNSSALRSFINAQASDPVSAFGGIVACNFKINQKVALEINKTFSGLNLVSTVIAIL